MVMVKQSTTVDSRWFQMWTWEARRYWEAKPPASSVWARRPWCMWWWFTVGTMLPASGIHICVSRPIPCCSICLVESPYTGPNISNQLASLLLSNLDVAWFRMILQRSLLCHFTSIIFMYTIINMWTLWTYAIGYYKPRIWMHVGRNLFSPSNLVRFTNDTMIPSLGF